MAVNGINSIDTVLTPITGTKKNDPASDIPFADFLKDALNQTNDMLLESERLNEDFAAGKIDNILDVIVAGQKADIALQFTMQIRNKILDAYNEIMRMQI